ncbi:MAG: LysR family transcriptional regulator [Betaproteobacteria bacterium]|jgi:DNA-binding transcriptional LysR family regulator|nr:LysR family transcriptional regulator [Betaproteobacteria bacterium]MBP6645619.1 LysR family transcriptional regulator [Burkholderiaceae bacterium]
MEFRHLRYFLALAEELHFGRAAKRLSISQPPLSLNIQQLESSVGAQLFVRNSREVRLTAAGQAFVPKARALLDQAVEAAQHVRDVQQGLVGHLHIGFVGAMLYRGLPQMLRQFEADHPSLQVSLHELNSQDQLIALTQDRLDLGFVHTTRVPPQLSRILVASQPFVCCLPVSHRLAKKRRVALADLQGEPFAMVSRAVSPDYHERLISLCTGAGFHPDIRYELRHWLSVVSLVSQGLGVALVPEALQQSRLPDTVFVPLASDSTPYETYCLWKKARDHAAMAAFLDTVRSARQE